MGQYEEQTYDEIIQWKRKILKKPKMFQRMTKGVQEKINEKSTKNRKRKDLFIFNRFLKSSSRNFIQGLMERKSF